MKIAAMLLAFVLAALGQVNATTLEWDPNPDVTVVGYKVYHGFASRQYVDIRDAGASNVVVISETPCGVEHFFAVTAYTIDGMESDYSEEVSYTPRCPKPDAPGELRISSRTNFVTLEWSQDLIYWEALGSFPMSNSNGFFRTLK